MHACVVCACACVCVCVCACGRLRVRVLRFGAIGAGLAAGRTFTTRTLTAGWAARYGHTSVVDAAGAIYVIGGSSTGFLQDVWASTDGGAQAGRLRGVTLQGGIGGNRGY